MRFRKVQLTHPYIWDFMVIWTIENRHIYPSLNKMRNTNSLLRIRLQKYIEFKLQKDAKRKFFNVKRYKRPIYRELAG